jgi:transcriptional regulator with XRE-family HTH domain
MKTQKFDREIDIGHTLMRYRHQHRYTQQYIANMLEISLTAYKKWEKKTDSFNINQLKKIAEIYTVSIELIIIDSYIDKTPADF